MSGWRPIDTAPKDGTRIEARRKRTLVDRLMGRSTYEKHVTYWGKTSHVPLYGWNWGRDVENQTIWFPTHWRPYPEMSEWRAPGTATSATSRFTSFDARIAARASGKAAPCPPIRRRTHEH